MRAALNSLPAHTAQPRTVLIKNGMYREKIAIDGKDYLILKGKSEKRMVLT